MAVKDLQVWTCDGCGSEWERERSTTRNIREQPEGWVGIEIRIPALAAQEAKDNPPRRVLCNECVPGLHKVLGMTGDGS